MSIFTLNNHYSPVFTFVNSVQKIFDAIKPSLYINISHTNLIKVLYFVICYHPLESSGNLNIIKRQKPKSKAVSFHDTEGGAIPTLAHQISQGLALCQ